MIRRLVAYFDERLGGAPLVRGALRYVFPDHWSFMLGEIALYAFVVLVGTGVYLTFFYVPSDETVTYSGVYEPLQGFAMGEQYASVVDLSFEVPAGLLFRQAHHWAANVFIAAIVLHLIRIVLTGAYRKPRELNYWVGLTMLALAIFNGFTGYSMIDDLLSGEGLAIAYAVALSIPVVGGDFAFLVWGGEYAGSSAFWPRLEIVHVLVVPVAIAALITAHMLQIARAHHTQFPGRRRTEKQLVGTPMWPGYALRSLGLLFATTAVLFLLGGLVQINPIWEWGPYEPHLSSNAAQPDWYLGWLLGGLRLVPGFDVTIFDYTLVPSPFWGGVLFPTVVFAVLYLWPWLGRRYFGDRGVRNLLDRPRENPRRTAVFWAFLSWVAMVFSVGSIDRLYFLSFIPYEEQIWVLRALTLLLPFAVYYIARRICEELLAREVHPLRGWTGTVVRRTEAGGFETVGDGQGADGEAARRRERSGAGGAGAGD